MAGLFGILGVSSSGLRVAQGGIRNVSQNIANASTPGYSRQRQIVSTSSSIEMAQGYLGTGAEQISIVRISDPLVQAEIVRENAAYGSTDMQASALSRIEEIFNEQSGYGIGTSLSAFYTSFDDLAASPAGSTEREAVIGSAENLLDVIHAADAELRNLQTSTQGSIDTLIPEINDLTSRIAQLNTDIKVQGTNHTPNEMLDERDALVRELSEMVEVQTFDQDGQLTIVLPSGLALVEGGLSNDLVSLPSGSALTQIGLSRGGSVLDVTDEISGGQLGGLLRVRDDTLPATLGSLDSIAYNLVVSVNNVHSAGTGLDGTVGNFFTDLPGIDNAARDIAIDPNILASSDAIAAGLSSEPGDNENALLLSGLRDAALPVYLPGDVPGAPTGASRTLLDYTAGFVAEVGHDSASMQASLERQAGIADLLANRREEVSGVSIDEETTMLIQLEAAYSANARVLQVIDDLLQDVLNLI